MQIFLDVFIIFIIYLNKKMLRQVIKRNFNAGRVTKYSGRNINVTEHNLDKREEFQTQSPTFWNTFNMPYEGFSKPWTPPRMHPIIGNRGEFLFLALFFPAVLILRATREKNENGVR